MSVFHGLRAKRASLLLMAASALMGLTGCGLPGQGAATFDVMSSDQRVPSDVHSGFIVTELDERVVQILANTAKSSFYGGFGDRRPAATQRIGIGDAITVTIWEASSGGLFSAPVADRNSPGSHTAVIPEQTVTQHGYITVPYAGQINVLNKTTPEVQEAIIQGLQGKAIEPQALVTVSRNVSNTVTVGGEVVNGARVPLSPRGDRILDVLATAGGVRAPIHESFLSLTRGQRTSRVPMQLLLMNPRENIYVQPGDTLVVERVPQSFTAFGATGLRAVVNFDAAGISLEEAIAKSGGLLEFQSDPEGVFLLRFEPPSVAVQIDPSFPIPPGKTAVEVVYRINLRNTNSYFLARQVKVQNKDILYIASSPLTNLQKIMSIISPVTGTAATAVTLAQ